MPQNSRNSLLTWDGRLFKVAETNTNLYFFTKSSKVLHLITSQSLYLPLFKKLLPITSEIQIMFKTIEPILTSFLTHSVFINSCMERSKNDIRNAPSVASFKYKLNRNLNASPKFYNAGSRKGQVLHVRLRLLYSSLNSDLHRKHIVPCPTCQCGGFESATHFFLTVQFSRLLGKDICLTILKITQLENFYLEKKTQQSKTTNHCKAPTFQMPTEIICKTDLICDTCYNYVGCII